VKSNWKGTHKKSVYQFKHLVLQEFLCSLFLSITRNIKPYLSNRELASCTPTLLGIDRLKNEKSNPLFITFFDNLVKIFKEERKLFRPPLLKSLKQKRMYKNYILEKLSELTVPTLMIEDEELVIDDRSMSHECMDFLSKVYESKYVNTQRKKFQTVRIVINDNNNINLKQVLYLLDILNIYKCCYLYNSRYSEVPKELWKIVRMSLCDELTTVLVFGHTDPFYLLMDASKLYINISEIFRSTLFILPEVVQQITNIFQLDLLKLYSTHQHLRYLLKRFRDVFVHVLESKKKLSISVNNADAKKVVHQYLSDNFDAIQIKNCISIIY